MNKSIFVGMVALVASTVSGFGYAADSSNMQARLRSEMIGNLEFMRNEFHTQYAPADWKKTFTNWDLDGQINQAQESIRLSSSPVSVREYQKTLRNLFLSTRDYHTSISFLSTESATLPFTVKGAEGRYFIVYIDRTKLSEDAFPFHEGDELVRFGDQSADEAVKGLLANTIINSSQTDQELSELDLTNRRAARGLAVPQGPITIAIRPKGSDSVFTRQLIWSYNPERIPNPLFQALSQSQRLEGSSPFLKRTMLAGNFEATDGASRVENPYSIGARKTFTPDLGKKIWQSSDSDPFYAYIFQNTDKKLIGYIRIPSYVASMYTTDYAAAVAHFRKLVTLFESTTDGLVIDQVNNPGGSVSYLYSLVSMLSDQAVKTPRHRMRITQADVMAAIQGLEKISQIKNDADAEKILGEVLDGYPATYQIAQFYKVYYEFIINEFKAGHLLTAPYWIEGVDQINPAADHFTKPILLVINGLDFSGGDFFPAILQDNKRVKVFGTRTAGAGGYVLDFSYPNLFGVDKFRLTGSIAERVDSNPIENLGVKPDVEYSITAEDLQNQYRGYIQAIQKTVSDMTR